MRKLPAFNPLIIFKAFFILFIAIGAGILYLLYRTNVTSITAWAGASVFTLFIAFLYITFFTDLKLFAGKTNDRARLDQLIYDAYAFYVFSPLLQQKTEIRWSNIETILYDDQPYHDYDSYGQRYTLIMKTPPAVVISPDAHWYNRVFRASRSKLKLYIDDQRNAHFQSLKQAIDLNLKVSSRYEDPKRGTLIKQTDHADGNTRELTQQWQPKRTDYPLQLIYDANNRDIRDVLLANGMLSE